MLWELLDFLKSTSNPVFTDHVIHMLMIALTIFSRDDPDRNVRDVHAVAESMLRTHLSSEEEVMLVLRSVSLLPRIAQLKQKMLTEVKNFAPAAGQNRFRAFTTGLKANRGNQPTITVKSKCCSSNISNKSQFVNFYGLNVNY